MADYLKSDQIADLMRDIGPERIFPPELLPTSPDMSRDNAALLWREHFGNARVFYTKSAEIWEVRDFCDRTSTYQYSPNLEKGGNWYIGHTVGWSVEPLEFNEWHQPRLVTTNEADERQLLVSRGWSAVSGGTLFPPEDAEPITLTSAAYGDVSVRIFDYPDCPEIQPLREASPSEWDLLGLSTASLITDYIDADAPQLPINEVIDAWRQHLSDQVVFHNFAKTPHYFLCADGTGIDVGRYCALDNYGRHFQWKLQDASALAKNAVFIVFNYEDDEGKPYSQSDPVLLDIEGQQDPFVAFIGLTFPGCSVQKGVDYLETVPDPREGLLR